MDKITDNLYIGNSYDALHSKSILKAAGITAILNVAKDLDNPFLSPNNFSLHKVGLGDGSGNTEENLLGAIKTLHSLLSEGHRVLIHCHEGRSRSSSVVAAYLWALGQFSDIDAALSYLKTVRPLIRPETGMRQDYIDLGIDKLKESISEST